MFNTKKATITRPSTYVANGFVATPAKSITTESQRAQIDEFLKKKKDEGQEVIVSQMNTSITIVLLVVFGISLERFLDEYNFDQLLLGELKRKLKNTTEYCKEYLEKYGQHPLWLHDIIMHTYKGMTLSFPAKTIEIALSIHFKRALAGNPLRRTKIEERLAGKKLLVDGKEVLFGTEESYQARDRRFKDVTGLRQVRTRKYQIVAHYELMGTDDPAYVKLKKAT